MDFIFLVNLFCKSKSSIVYLLKMISFNKYSSSIACLMFVVFIFNIVFKKREYKLLVKQLKGFLNVTEVNPIELYLEGYLDTLENKETLDRIFKKL